MDIRTLSQQQLASMSLQEACKAIQALYTPEEWARMAHTPAATFTAEQIEQAAREQAWDDLQAVPAYVERLAS